MDKLLSMLFDPDRWKAAIDKGIVKGINKAELKRLCSEEVRIDIYQRIKNGEYAIAPPHTALIPKDTPGEYRTVYINEPMDRVLLSIINDLFFEVASHMINANCMSYQKGKSCGMTVKNLSKCIANWPSVNGYIGFKADLSKYFDSVPIEFIDQAFDSIEELFGKSKVIDLVRNYYHCDLYFDTDGELQEKYQSLKQGCAVAAWLADVVLYDIDTTLSQDYMGEYVRYSDDIMYIGSDWELAKMRLGSELEKLGLRLNPKKVELIDKDHWVKFLGYSIKGSSISLSSSGIKKFQKEVEAVTIKNRKITYDSAVHKVYRALYKGFEDYSWAARVLRVINVDEDINTLNAFVMDCLRAVQTNKKKLGGLGFKKEQKVGCIARGTGRNVKANREKIPELKGYITIGCMAKDLKTGRAVFDTVVRML